MRKSKFMLAVIVLFAVGFSAVSTTLYLNGSFKIGTNNADFDVKFTKATSEANAIATISPDGKSITFETSSLSTVGDISKLDFEVTNNSIMYDADVSIDCTATGTNKGYYEITKEVETPIAAQTIGVGKVEVKLVKAALTDFSEEFTCTLNGTAKERISKAEILESNKTLYEVLQTEVESGGVAKEYTGEHQDSIFGIGDKKIYFYYAKTNTGSEVRNKNNVIFADHCWKMVRTTDTGGVKLIYNGEVENGMCLDTRGTHVGYNGAVTLSLSDNNYYYGSDYTYDDSSKKFSLAGTLTQATWNSSNYPSLIGKYTCKSLDENGSCETLYYIESSNIDMDAYALSLSSDSHYSQIGITPFNSVSSSPAYVGYMYNTVYPYANNRLDPSEYIYSSGSLNTSYWYADSYTYNSDTEQYSLVDPYQVTSDNYSNLVGKYTLESTSSTGTNSRIQYITTVSGEEYYYLSLSSNKKLKYYDSSYTYGDSYTDNEDGTYTIVNPTVVKKTDWFNNYTSVSNKYVCKNAIDNTCSDVWYITSTKVNYAHYIPIKNSFLYSNKFSYSNGEYVLDKDDSVNFWNITDDSNKLKLNNAHYTCFNDSGKCSELAYIYYINETKVYYILLKDNKSIDTALKEMLSADNVNAVNSVVKSAIDAWYEKYLINYTEYLENTVFCNNRSIYDLGGWNPNGGDISTDLNFKGFGTDSLACPNETDRFSVENSKARLKYPVGLMSITELDLPRGETSRTDSEYWTASAYTFDDFYSRVYGVYSNGWKSNYGVTAEYGVRPSISLAPGTMYGTGNGSTGNPYVVVLR